jgi:hypothetical protein
LYVQKNCLQVLLLDDEVHHVLRQQPGLPLLVGLVDAAQVLPAKADATKCSAARTKPQIRFAGKVKILFIWPFDCLKICLTTK